MFIVNSVPVVVVITMAVFSFISFHFQIFVRIPVLIFTQQRYFRAPELQGQAVPVSLKISTLAGSIVQL